LIRLPSLRRIVFGSDPRRTTVRIVVLAAASLITFRWILIPVRATGDSMLPTYRSGQLCLVYRLAYATGLPSRGDVVAIRLAGLHAVYVKRVVALPGERIEIAKGEVRVNGTALREPYVKFRTEWQVPEVQLGPTEYYVIGDNRGMPAAAHTFGRVEAGRIAGEVMF
jgi:signal peptidase I